jgi:hypothetical protein
MERDLFKKREPFLFFRLKREEMRLSDASNFKCGAISNIQAMLLNIKGCGGT